MKHTAYVLTFMFDINHEWVWLIEKQKPAWQKGCLNGIGGKIEEGETHDAAAARELHEESGLLVEQNDLTYIGLMRGKNNDESSFEVHIYAGTTFRELHTMEEEKIDCYEVCSLYQQNTIENVPMIVEACIYRLTGQSNFSKLIMEY